MIFASQPNAVYLDKVLVTASCKSEDALLRGRWRFALSVRSANHFAVTQQINFGLWHSPSTVAML